MNSKQSTFKMPNLLTAQVASMISLLLKRIWLHRQDLKKRGLLRRRKKTRIWMKYKNNQSLPKIPHQPPKAICSLILSWRSTSFFWLVGWWQQAQVWQLYFRKNRRRKGFLPFVTRSSKGATQHVTGVKKMPVARIPAACDKSNKGCFDHTLKSQLSAFCGSDF